MIAVIVGTILLLVLGYIRLYRHYRRNIRKVAFMFDAMDNVDYTFQFPVNKVSRDDKVLNSALNRIKRIMENARSETMEREKYYERIINSVDTGILVVDERGNVRQYNDAAMRLIGVSALTHIDQLKRISNGLYRQIRDILPGEKSQVSFSNEREECHLSLRASHTLLKGCKVRLVTISDINIELDDNEMDSWIKLIRVLTHEIMNTVTPITSLSETLFKKADGEMRDGLEVIHKTSRELIAFVENYRKFTHVPTPVPSLFYIKPFLERMVRLAEQQTTGKEIVIDRDAFPDDLILYADESLVGHVVTNLLKNAIQALDAGGKITIKAYCNESEAVIIDISDNGPMIPEDVAQHIFVPFFTTKKEGSGIGLPVSKQIMRLSGGTLMLKSDKNQGLTTFSMVFY
ncbi:MAG: ATP-binding protein [Prevotella sp.]|jgi:nitrogen fixation/metabolism regulation signal transduction histidine kinase|nr:ATP-binding protein [Prevotella sp.]MCH4241152.1 ATP-binding protein [Prevotella sp.]